MISIVSMMLSCCCVMMLCEEINQCSKREIKCIAICRFNITSRCRNVFQWNSSEIWQSFCTFSTYPPLVSNCYGKALVSGRLCSCPHLMGKKDKHFLMYFSFMFSYVGSLITSINLNRFHCYMLVFNTISTILVLGLWNSTYFLND